jgi:hypothetical protein
LPWRPGLLQPTHPADTIPDNATISNTSVPFSLTAYAIGLNRLACPLPGNSSQFAMTSAYGLVAGDGPNNSIAIFDANAKSFDNRTTIYWQNTYQSPYI